MKALTIFGSEHITYIISCVHEGVIICLHATWPVHPGMCACSRLEPPPAEGRILLQHNAVLAANLLHINLQGSRRNMATPLSTS